MKVFWGIASFAFFSGLYSCNFDQQEVYDTKAIATLDRMCEVIGELESCSFTLEASSNQINDGKMTVRERSSQLYVEAPDKLFVYTNSPNGRKGYWYDGNQLAVFRYDQKTFDTISVAGNIHEMMDRAHHAYDVEFPGADIFYPTFTDDLMADHDTIVLLENEQDQNVISILAKGDQDFVVIDIDGETGLPLKLEIVNRADNSIYYEANFSHWKTNPKFRPELFRFDIPEGHSN